MFPYLFKTAVDHIKAKHVTTRPYTPRTNRKAERFIQTSVKEWAYSQAHENSEERTEHLKPWTDFYNQQRPHSALNRKPPISRLHNCEQCPC
ncbi:integrase core domain-containing protein [Dethiosulfatarculus sandiegensis]|uniref:integrase core domain-containing protein n=1 Tax=Dethiosulfatarculus sandiegensis TaxID=1429043 RepID=UPI00339051EE